MVRFVVLRLLSADVAYGYCKDMFFSPAAITLITLVKQRGSWGRSMGTTVGVVAGLGIGGYSAAHTDSGGAAVAVLVAVTSGVAVIGYYAGKGLDTRRTRITILP